MLTLRFINNNVHSVHLSNGSHVGNLKRIGALWKFKAVGYEADGSVIPGGGPYTKQHNTQLSEPQAQTLSAALSGSTEPLP